MKKKEEEEEEESHSLFFFSVCVLITCNAKLGMYQNSRWWLFFCHSYNEIDQSPNAQNMVPGVGHVNLTCQMVNPGRMEVYQL
jgi:hypothetical protein